MHQARQFRWAGQRREAPQRRATFHHHNVHGILTFDPASRKVDVFADRIGTDPMVNANDLAFDAKGGLYVTVPGKSNYVERNGQVVYFAPGSRQGRTIASGLGFPNGIALLRGGQFLAVGLYAEKTIMVMPTVGNEASPRSPYAHVRTEGGIGPDGMAFDTEGRLYWANFNSGAVGISDRQGFVLGYAKLPDSAGLWTTNVALHTGWLYLTEATQGVVWRMKVTTSGAPLFGRSIAPLCCCVIPEPLLGIGMNADPAYAHLDMSWEG